MSPTAREIPMRGARPEQAARYKRFCEAIYLVAMIETDETNHPGDMSMMSQALAATAGDIVATSGMVRSQKGLALEQLQQLMGRTAMVEDK